MSNAKPLDPTRRAAHYRHQNGYREFTPAQRRRDKKKQNEMARRGDDNLPRVGRLRRRFDRKDQRELKARAAMFVSLVRARKGQP